LVQSAVLEPIDLRHLGVERVIGVYRIETPDGPALFDCGPATCYDELRRQVDLADIRHLLLSHIHLDHAGAAGHLVRDHPHVAVHVHAVGAPHLVDPSRLINSARRLYGDTLDTLYGEPLSVPSQNVHALEQEAAGLRSFATPGHASHHASYMDADGTLYAGDATGVRILPGTFVVPHAPPPDIDLEAWERTFEQVLLHQPARLALIHFGVVEGTEEVATHVARARTTLHAWAGRVRGGITHDEFVSAAEADIEASEGEGASTYANAAPLTQSYLGLERYWRKEREREAAVSGSATSEV
jgi:glyoxylase-like metal-dependent hydrolase (beta-lactamase superfamily II)